MVTLRAGMTGPEVKKLQTALNRAGATLKKDGIYGAATVQAVKNFQEDYGLKIDGICGPTTWGALGPYLQDFSALEQAVEECLAAVEKLPEYKRLEAFFDG